jgi:hypothetical protein
MIYRLLIPSARTKEHAVALLIVLAFLVLLAGMTVAYLSRTAMDRKVAHGSFNDAKSEQLARSAVDIIVADFRQEIANGGTAPTNANVAPQRSPKPAFGSTPAIPNLIRRSVRSDGILAPAIPSRASAVNSTANISLNGRSISISRWNSHYLIPKSNTADSSSDPITAGFSAPNYWAPDWVIVTRNGPASFNSWDSTLSEATSSNTKYALGRYAYAVYDEGGLLDANVVGLPSPTPTVTDVGRKGHAAFADLTGMKLTSTGTTPNPTMISKMVAWRNYATLQSSGTFAALSPSPNPSPLFANYFLDTSRDFRTVATTVYNNKTDQAFLTRRQLINIFQGNGTAGSSGIGGSYNMLQFLGTFSREKNVPTWTAGTAALTQRFALGNLALVKPNPGSSIQTLFGLKWVAGTPGTSSPTIPGHWQYVGSSGTALRDRIPAFTTNPEFFQLLNYAMNGTNTDDTAHIYTTLSIGAAVIDQYDDSAAADPLTGTTTTMIEYNGGWAFGLENTDPGRPPASPSPSPLPAGMSPTPPPAVSGYVMLNRPFRNVGELGYAFSASAGTTPTPSPGPKTIDFYTATSPDAPILDLFTYNTAAVRAGTVNLNTQNPAVIAALLKGTITAEPSASPMGLAASNNAAASPTPNPNIGIIANTSSGSQGTLNKPAVGRQDIPRLVAAAGNFISSASEEEKETIARALGEIAQTRTWGLFIDVIAQSGRYPPNARALSDFVVEGEKRYWLHVAIDRFTGEVIDQQLEEVFE